MYLFMITLIIGFALVSRADNDYEKCCSLGYYMQKSNNSYQCAKNENKRLEILTNKTNFLGENSEGQCLDVSTDIFIYNVSDSKITGESFFLEKIFPKCCPVGYSYNSVFHSCDKRENLTHDFIQEIVVKVGLPKCKVIVDYELNGPIDSSKSLFDTINKQLERNSHHYPGSYCIDGNERGKFVMRECKENLQVCENIKCVKKCCPDGQSFINGSRCYDTYTHGLNVSSFSVVENPGDPFAIIHNRTCPKIYQMKNKYIFSLDTRGVYKYWSNHTQSFVYDDIGQMNSYCIEHTTKAGIEGDFFFMCFPEKIVKQKFEYTYIPKILSCILLMLTIVIYLILNETSTLFGKILVNYCFATFFGFAALAYSQNLTKPTLLNCQITGYVIIFFFTAAFTWSSVMCCDIWWTFGNSKLGAHMRNGNIKKLLMYSLCGWGLPFAWTLIIFLFCTYQVLPYSIQPFIGVRKCFFERRENNYGQALFYNLPQLILQLINTVLFFKTVFYCLKVKNEINKINDTTKDDKTKKFHKDKQRLFLILKLAVIMSLFFIFEVVSAFFEMSKMGVVLRYIEVVLDFIICSQGVFIFIIFICKKKIWLHLLRKFKKLRAKNSSTLSIYTHSTTTSLQGRFRQQLDPFPLPRFLIFPKLMFK